MHYRKLWITLAAAALSVSACGDKDNPINPVPTGTVRFANAITDSQPMDARIEGLPDNADNITIGTASGEKDVPSGNYRVTLSTVRNSSTVEFTDDSVDVDDGMVTFVYGVGRLADDSQEVLAFEAPDTDLTDQQTEYQFVNVTSPTQGSLDVFVTAPTDTLPSATPKATLAYKAFNQPTTVSPGPYRIRITPQGDRTTVLFDSGATGIAFPAASTQQFAIAQNSSGGLFLMVLTGDGGNHQIQNAGI